MERMSPEATSPENALAHNDSAGQAINAPLEGQCGCTALSSEHWPEQNAHTSGRPEHVAHTGTKRSRPRASGSTGS